MQRKTVVGSKKERMFARSLLTVLCVALLAAVAAGKTHPFRSRRSPGDVIKNYDVVRPRILHKDSFLPHPKLLEVEICNGNSNFTLKLELNENLFPPHFTSKHYDQDGKEVVTTGQANCFYQGEVLEHPEWSVVVSTCTGLRASFGLRGDKEKYYHMEPLGHTDTSVEEDHALYSDSEIKTINGVCGSDHANPRIPEDMHINIPDIEKVRERRQSARFLYVEMVIVNDNTQYAENGRSISKTVQRSLEITNMLDELYRALALPKRIRVSLVDVITWTQGDQIVTSTNPDTLLDNFRQYYISISSPHDTSLLLTGKDLNGDTVGQAFVGAMCDDSYSVGVVQDGGRSDTNVAATVAHELGHIFNMDHDDISNCGCPDGFGKCIMASFIFFPPPTKWSQCSINDVTEGFNTYNLDHCLFNVPTTTIGVEMCGDGIRGGDEECDCGSVSECTDTCCNANTCKLVAGAECSPLFGDCCNNQCKLRAYGATCRAASGACDIAEYCYGASAECPIDSHSRDGTSCNNGQAYCFAGKCSKTLAQQCREHFGPSASPAHMDCFDSNTRGSLQGNCGYTSTRFIPCAPSDVTCGMLFCSGGSFQSLGISGTIVNLRGSFGECQGFTPQPTDFTNPVLVDDGASCGTGKVCYEQQCKGISQVISQQTCPSSNSQECSGNGKCSNRGMCVCDVGYVGDNCATEYASGGPESGCETNNGGCAHICTDRGSSTRCSCRTGYQLDSDGKSCSNINECNTNNGGCSHKCIDSEGSYRCGCTKGYTLQGSDGFTCNNVNECDRNNDGCSHICMDTDGSFTCSCRSGYTLATNGKSCNIAADVDECSTNNGGCGHTCTNTQGSFECSCRNGYTLAQNGRRCNNINECNTNNGGCSQICIDTEGSFGCGCRSGYAVSSDGTSCSNINECDTNNGGCSQNCRDTEGSFRCGCRRGYTIRGGDGFTCNNVNECDTNNGGCSQICTNTVGSFRCSCRSGYTLASDGRSCMIEGSANECGVLTTATGFVESAGWPERYSRNSDCEWTISLPNNRKKVEITFNPQAYGLAGNSPCTRDYVEIFDGPDILATSLGRFCGCCANNTPAPFTASGSIVKVVFHSGSKNHGPRRKGFRIDYQSV